MYRNLYFLILFLSLGAGAEESYLERLDDLLLSVAKERGCNPIPGDRYTNFPLYSYGYISGIEKKESAVFWCKKENSEYPGIFMMIWLSGNQKIDCSLERSYINIPGETAILHDYKKSLSYFVNMEKPHERGPSEVITVGPVIKEEYDGAGSYFYCYNGNWYISQFH